MTSFDGIEQQLNELQANKDRWAITDVGERVHILDAIRRGLLSVTENWVALCMEAKGMPVNSRGEGEEWGMLGNVYNLLDSLRSSLTDIKRYGRPRIVGPVSMLPNGQVSARVFPRTRTQAMLYSGLSEEVWMEPGVTVEETLQSQAQIYRGKAGRGAVNLVLGAGNASSLPVNDGLCKLFLENHVVVLKLNPVNAYLRPLIEKALSSLIERGFFRLVSGGIAEGNYLCNHPAVDEIHLTGSDKTFEAIMFGPGPEGARRKANRTPLISKNVTGELGNITPIIIVPGPWSGGDIKKQAEKIAGWLVSNAGCNCLTPRVLVQHRDWPQRERLVEAISDVVSGLETRRAYYPGAEEKHAAFVSAHPEARQLGRVSPGHLPWTLVADVDPGNTGDICFNTEAFCSLFAETGIEAEGVPEFIDRAVDFANRTLWGTLTASIIIHPKSVLDPDVVAGLDRALTNLRYGTICINDWGGSAYDLALTPWGGFPGQDIYDVQSGIGATNNSLMFNKAQKAVIRGPFIKTPDPGMVTFRHYSELEREFTYYLASGSKWRIPGIVWTSLRG
jgi:acyl-CoA reductase-like NAD-dependent aldehyde dehydrogenase